MSAAFDLLVLGSGFGGTLTAMVARRLGLKVLLVERGAHPRFAIGESTSPLANLLLEELAVRYELPRLLPLTAFGPWRREYPQLPVGLKRGFTYYRHETGRSFGPDPERARQLLVAASPHDEVADTHWYRSELDWFLLREAQALGAEYVDCVELTGLERAGESVTVSGERSGRAVRYGGRFLIDATGPRGAVSRLLSIPEEPFSEFPATQALFSHFTGVRRFAECAGTGDAVPPYPPDDAALHHLFDGGWMWVLRFNHGITSAGIAVEERLAADLRLADPGAWGRFLARYPSVGEQFAEAEAVRPLVHSRRLSYRAARCVGPGWAMLPSAAAFVDPLFSTGFPLTLLGVHRLARLLECWKESGEIDSRLPDYAAVTRREAEAAAHLVAGSYGSFSHFPTFANLSMLYFAAASYSEMARRLGRGDLAAEFLLQSRLPFRTAYQSLCAAARSGAQVPFPGVAAAVEPVNIAGLCDPEKRNWYGVDLTDVVRGAAKLEQSEPEVRAFIRRMGW